MNYGYDYSYDYRYNVAEVNEMFIRLVLIIGLVIMVIAIFTIICQWKIFTKAGKPGWAAMVPIYNIIVMLDIAKMPTWNILLYLIPFVNIYMMFKMNIEIAHNFGKSTGFGVGLSLLPIVFMPMLAFGAATYEGSNQNYAVDNNQPMYEPNQMYYDQQSMNQVPQQGFTANAQSLNYDQQPVSKTSVEQAQYCSQCGQQMAPDAMFCTACGHKR